ncbi:tellurite resistance TerB C-terminal domain-containing protein [Chryseobacterium sp. MYb264]|uniref:tellurite resistance TerB C-terminal domain-containing protein n=1 Tax=Chryseobacterium sp. MYb264 TaxID=2745153 RepID=UPI002E13FF93|nr:tellurite resistance TerB C-terminal domain-containing protein [Chryseobacterium sp. MYb264]
MTTFENSDLQIVTTKARADKAINSLKGLLLGIISDDIIDAKEMRELRLWAQEHYDLVNRNPFREFMLLIENTASNEIPTKEAVEDLYWLCQKYEHDSIYYNGITSDLQLLQGIFHGILADGILSDEEIFKLDAWLSENKHLSSYYPYDEIRSLVSSVVEDGIITEEERAVLTAFIKQFVEIKNKEVADKIERDTININISGICAQNREIIFTNKTFCITGILNRGSRTELQKAIQDQGGISVNSISKKTDYLIIGSTNNACWTYSCYGRKVEKALELRKSGHTIILIHESDIFNNLDGNHDIKNSFQQKNDIPVQSSLSVTMHNDSVTDVSGHEDIAINFCSDFSKNESVSADNKESNIVPLQEAKIGKRYSRKLNLNENQEELLNQLSFDNNAFNEIDYCKVQILKQFLRSIEFLNTHCIPVNKSYSSVIDELSEIIIYLQYNYKPESLNYKYTYDSIRAEILNHIIKLCENNVREFYGIKRKISEDFTYSHPDILIKYNKKIISKLQDFLVDHQHQILDADYKTNIILNENNTNRWKTKFEIIKEDYSNSLAFEREIFRLTDVNIKNPSVDNIFFEASKFIAGYDKTCALRLYIHYLDKDLNSQTFDKKQLTKTIQKSLFSTSEQFNDFEKIVSDFVVSRDIETAIGKVNLLYTPKRKKIFIDTNAVENVQRLDSEIAKKLGDILNEEYEDENTSAKTEEALHKEELTISITNKDSEPEISKYLEELNFTEIQCEILTRFEKHSFTIFQNDLKDFIQSKNLFMGSAIDSINEVCYEILDDVLIEEEDEYFTINTDYYKKLLNND